MKIKLSKIKYYGEFNNPITNTFEEPAFTYQKYLLFCIPRTQKFFTFILSYLLYMISRVMLCQSMT